MKRLVLLLAVMGIDLVICGFVKHQDPTWGGLREYFLQLSSISLISIAAFIGVRVLSSDCLTLISRTVTASSWRPLWMQYRRCVDCGGLVFIRLPLLFLAGFSLAMLLDASPLYPIGVMLTLELYYALVAIHAKVTMLVRNT